MRKSATIAALAGVAALAGGCGGGDEDQPPSKDEFIAQADKACVGSALRPKAPPQNAQQAAAQTAEEAKARQELQTQLEKIEAPAEVKADYDQFLAKSKELIAGLQRMSALAKGNKRAEYGEEDKKLATAGQQREAIADRIGFKKCGQPFTAEERKNEQK